MRPNPGIETFHYPEFINFLENGCQEKSARLMHLLSEHGIRYEFTNRNPISKVRQGGQRLGTPARLDVRQLRLLLEMLSARERIMILVDFGTGLRRGELSGVKWEDIDFQEGFLTPKRSIVQQHEGNVKRVT